jgi:tRNA threonylcarbamoyl adenosine modification protein YeaZ
MYILGIESSTKRLNIAISRENRLLYQNSLFKDSVFMSRIIPLIDRSLKKVKIDLSSIDVFSVDTGPGDFTGTRIGISVARSFSMANKRPVFGIPGLDIFATGLFGNNAYRIQSVIKKGFTVILFPVLDVKHGELFFGIYEVSTVESKNAIARITSGGTDYFIKKTIPGHLVECEKINDFFENLIQKEGLMGILPVRNHVIFTGGTAFGSPADLLTVIKKLKYNFILSKKSIFPEARFLNLCAFYRVLEQSGKSNKDRISRDLRGKIKGDSAVIPIYVREFVPFGRYDEKSTRGS